MDLLLDTHIWIWTFLDPGRVGPKVDAALRAPENELWLSPVAIWELMLLTRKGRVQLDSPVENWVAQALKRKPVHEAPLTFEVALEVSKLHVTHGDPADRFMVATARVFSLTLATADQRLIRSREVSVLPNS